jgi:hypothetical protein
VVYFSGFSPTQASRRACTLSRRGSTFSRIGWTGIRFGHKASWRACTVSWGSYTAVEQKRSYCIEQKNAGQGAGSVIQGSQKVNTVSWGCCAASRRGCTLYSKLVDAVQEDAVQRQKRLYSKHEKL